MSNRSDELQHEALHRLLAVSRKLSASADLTQILSVIIDAMRDLLDAERATVFEYSGDSEELFSTVAHGLMGAANSTDESESSGTIRFSTEKGLAGECARTKNIINVPDAHADDRFNPEFDRQTGFRTRSLLTIPLLGHDGELIGVSQVLNKRDGAFTEEDEQIAAALASQAAVALKRGRLIEDRLVREKLERDLELARRIQQRSFPSLIPILNGFDIEAWSEPADETGGDTYDIIGFSSQCADAMVSDILTPAERVVLFMGDATGHGVGPALSVTQARSMLRMAVRMDADLEQIALHLNQQLCQDLPEGRFITAWLGELDVNRQVLTSFSAGHGPMLRYIAAEERIVQLEADTLPFGLVDQLNIAVETQYSMNPGDLFIVPSDGIFDTVNPRDEDFGLERVEAVIRKHHAEPAIVLGERIRVAVDTFRDGHPMRDDQTLIIVRRAPV